MYSWFHRTILWSLIQNLKTDREISALKNCPNCWRSASEPKFAPLINISKHLQKSWKFTDMYSWFHRTRLWSFIQNIKIEHEISALKNCPNCWRSASEPNFAPLVNISKHLQKAWKFTDMHSWLHRARLWSFIQNHKTYREVSAPKNCPNS